MLTEKQRVSHVKMKEDLLASKDYYKPSGVLWDSLTAQFESILTEKGIGEIQSSELNHSFSLLDNDVFRTHYFKCALWLLYNNIKGKDKHHLLKVTEPLLPAGIDPELVYNAASVAGRPQHLEKKNLTWDYLITLDTIINIADAYPQLITDPCVVADLGAGWGRIGFVLMQVNENISYHVLDIPNSLIISQEYLREHLKGKCAVYEYIENRDKKRFTRAELLAKNGASFHISSDLEKFDDKSIDVLINVASFQEMSLSQITSYFSVIDKKAKYLYTQQRYQDLDMNHSIYPYLANWKKLFDRDVTFLPHWFEAMFRCT